MTRTFLAVCAAFLGITLLGAAPQPPVTVRSTVATLADLGYEHDVTQPGVYPSFTFNIPISRALTGVHLDLPIQISPLADGQSSIKVLANGVPIFAQTVAQLRRNPRISLDIPVPAKPVANLEISIIGYLYVTGDICYDLQTNDLWMTIPRNASLRFTTRTTDASAEIKDFFQGYENKITVVAPHVSALSSPALQIVKLPYAIRQIENWHQPAIVLAASPDPSGRNIVIQPGPTRYDSLRRTLFVDPKDLALFDSRISNLFVTRTVSNVAAAAPSASAAPANRLAFSELGLSSETSSGLGQIAFEVPLESSVIGGAPNGLVLHLSLVHSPLLGNNTAMTQVMLNGSLIGARELARDGRREVWDVAVPRSAISASNSVRILTSYFSGPGSCKGNLAKLTVTMENSSYFSWQGVDRSTVAIADFLKVMNGNVSLLIGSADLVPEAFHLMSEIGRINSHARRITVGEFNGAVPPGSDYTILVAQPGQLTDDSLPLKLGDQQFRIANPLSGVTEFGSTFGRSVGVMEIATLAKTPVFALSYWGGPGAFEHFTSIDAATLSQQLGDVSIFDGSVQTYSVGQKLRVYYASGDVAERWWNTLRLPVTIALGFLAIAFVLFSLRRLTGGKPRA